MSPRKGRSELDVPLAMDPDRFRRLGHELVDRVADHMGGLPGGPVGPGLSPGEVRDRLNADRGLPEQGQDPAEAVREAVDLLFSSSLFNGHPRFFGYITAGPSPIGILGDMLAAAVNPNVGGWSLSPMASEMESQTVRWLADFLGFPSGGDGLLVSGGNMANFVGFLAARAAAGARWGVRARGLAHEEALPLRVYASSETHTWLDKAADLFGLGTDAVRKIAGDQALRMDPHTLRATIRKDREEGLLPFLVVGTAGTTATGAIDPLPALAEICREEGLWFHVDGAYGGFAAAVPGAPPDLLGLREADSIAVDPHKWLYAPLEAGCVLVKDPETLRNAFSYHPPYYHFGQEATNFLDLGMQNSRGFRALKVWLALKQAGREGYRKMISQDMTLSRRLHERTDAHPELEAVTQALSISTFRFVPTELRSRTGAGGVDEYLNELNRGIQDHLEQGGKAFVSNAVVDGRYLLRACIVNMNTTTADVDALPDIVAEAGREVHEGLRQARLPRVAG